MATSRRKAASASIVAKGEHVDQDYSILPGAWQSQTTNVQRLLFLLMLLKRLRRSRPLSSSAKLIRTR